MTLAPRLPRIINRDVPRPLDSGDNPLNESFRLLALNVSRMMAAQPAPILAVLSAGHGDGRSLTAGGLGRALSEIAPPVLLLHADVLGGEPRQTEAAAWSPGDAGRLAPLNQCRVLVEATGLRSHAELVAWMEGILGSARGQGLTVVVDTPPCTVSSLAFSIAAAADGVLYVARRRRQDRRVHGDIRTQLDLIGARVLGIVFNEG